MEEKKAEVTTERMRRLKGPAAWLVSIIAALFSLFYIYEAGFGLISTEIHRGAYLLFTMLLCFMLYPLRKKSVGNKVPIIDWILCLLAAAAIIYWIVVFPSYALRVRNPFVRWALSPMPA